MDKNRNGNGNKKPNSRHTTYVWYPGLGYFGKVLQPRKKLERR